MAELVLPKHRAGVRFPLLAPLLLPYPCATISFPNSFKYMKKVAIYSTPTCTYCSMAKDFFKQHNIPYTEYDVKSDLVKRKEMIDRSQQMGVPVIDIDGKLMVGFDEAELSLALGI